MIEMPVDKWYGTAVPVKPGWYYVAIYNDKTNRYHDVLGYRKQFTDSWTIDGFDYTVDKVKNLMVGLSDSSRKFLFGKMIPTAAQFEDIQKELKKLKKFKKLKKTLKFLQEQREE
jgi:hypothetical protein